MKIVEENQLKKMAEFNKKHNKGWGWFVHPKGINTNTNAGNVPLNNTVFNANVGANTAGQAVAEGVGDNLNPKSQINNNSIKGENMKQIHKYDCYFEDRYIGTVDAKDEEEAYHKMEQEWPELPYGEYDGVAEVIELNEDLIQSDSDEAFKKNVQTELDAGKPRKQALAIAYSVKEKNRMKKEQINEENTYGVDYLVTTLEDIMEGMVDNTDPDVIDTSISEFRTIGHKLGVKNYDKINVLISNGEYDPDNYNFHGEQFIKKYPELKYYEVEDLTFIREDVNHSIWVYFKDERAVFAFIDIVDGLNNSVKEELNLKFDDIKEIDRLKKKIGIKDNLELDVFYENEKKPGETTLDTLKRYSKEELGDNFKLKESWNDYAYFVKCNDEPKILIRVVAENEDKAKEYVKNMYAHEHTTFADDRNNNWVIEDALNESLTYTEYINKHDLPDNRDSYIKYLIVELATPTEEAYRKASFLYESKNTRKDNLIQEIKDGIKKYFIVEDAFTEEDYEELIEDYLVVEVVPAEDDFMKVEVRVELGYDDLMDLIDDVLDPIIQKYDKDAYFDMEDAGITNTFINKKYIQESLDEAKGDKITYIVKFFNKYADDGEEKVEFEIEDGESALNKIYNMPQFDKYEYFISKRKEDWGDELNEDYAHTLNESLEWVEANAIEENNYIVLPPRFKQGLTSWKVKEIVLRNPESDILTFTLEDYKHNIIKVGLRESERVLLGVPDDKYVGNFYIRKNRNDLKTYDVYKGDDNEFIKGGFLSFEDASDFVDELVSESERLNEGKMKDLSIDVENAGGPEPYILEQEEKLKDFIDYRDWLDTQGRKEVGKGGQFDSIEELEETIEYLNKQIDKIYANINIIKKNK